MSDWNEVTVISKHNTRATAKSKTVSLESHRKYIYNFFRR